MSRVLFAWVPRILFSAQGAAHPFLAIAFGQAIGGAGTSGVLVAELGHGPALAVGATGAAALAMASRGCPEPGPAGGAA